MYLPVIKLKPRAGIGHAIWSINYRQTEYVSIERKGRIGVAHNERNMVNTSTTRVRHKCIMPVLARPRMSVTTSPENTV